MKKVLTIALLLSTLNSWGSDTSRLNRERAEKYVQKAILSIPFIRNTRKQLERYITRKIRLDKEVATVLGSTAMTLYKGEVNTKVIKKIRISILGGTMRPDIAYNFREKSVSSMAHIKWSF